jgi:hypothetical protein
MNHANPILQDHYIDCVSSHTCASDFDGLPGNASASNHDTNCVSQRLSPSLIRAQFEFGSPRVDLKDSLNQVRSKKSILIWMSSTATAYPATPAPVTTTQTVYVAQPPQTVSTTATV